MRALCKGARRLPVWCWLLLAAGAALFVERASVNGRLVNTRIERTDQGAYIRHAARVRETGFAYEAPRNRMPVYPSLLALTIREGDTPARIFERGKTLNVWLALGCLAATGVLFFRRLEAHAAMNGLFFAAFGVYVFKAPHTQAEILYYTLTFVFFWLCWEMFRKPGWLRAAGIGLVAGLAHLTKASILPGVFCFLVFYCADALGPRPVGGARKGSRWAQAGVVAACFLAVIWPYLSTSKRLHGSYFFNVNSTYYIWCDSWKEALAVTKKAKEAGDWRNLSEEERPGLAHYLRRHSFGEIAGRLGEGALRVVDSMRRSYGYFGLLVAASAAAAGVAAAKRRLVWRAFRRRPWPVAALAAYFCGYFALIAWYSQIIAGNRFVLALFLPFLYSLFVFIGTYGRRARLRAGAWNFTAANAFHAVFSVWLAAEIAVICVARIPSMYGGG